MNNNTKFTGSGQNIHSDLYEKYLVLSRDALKSGLDQKDLRNALLKSRSKSRKLSVFLVIGLSFFLGALWNDGFHLNNIHRSILSSRCVLQNNFFVMEVARPLADCNICKNVKNVVVLKNVTKEKFAQYAYSGRPVLVKGATAHWNATRTFTFDFFKKLYTETDGALESVEDECQFFPFRTSFVTLRDVFVMSSERALSTNEKSWYVGWSNCNPQVTEILRKHYSRPSFLPTDSESSTIDWIFMGWSGQGASVHLDYVQRPSWQAQISGRKTWRMFPTPECEHVCTNFTIRVEKGDIVLIDTNQWYHDTYIDPGELSITIGSEYD